MNMNKLMHSFKKELNWQTIQETMQWELRASTFEFVYPVNFACSYNIASVTHSQINYAEWVVKAVSPVHTV